ncbi:MAG: hypothetical protein HY925_11615, partial [Elusimicrobia bacterium]|nr:hypothetical protein [Elusimicrobiota bacterium]
MNPDNPSARAARCLLAAAILLNPAFSWSQRIIEAPIVPLSAGGASASGAGGSAVGLQTAGPNARQTLTAAALVLSPALSRANVSLPVSTLAGARGSALAGGLASPPSKARATPGAGTHKGDLAGTLDQLAAGVDGVAAAQKNGGLNESIQATGRIFGDGVVRRAASGTGSNDGANNGGGAGSSGGGNQNVLPNKMPLIRMQEPLFPGTRTHFYPGNKSTVELVAAAAAGENNRYLLVATARPDNTGLFPVASVVRVVDFVNKGGQDMAVFEVVSEAVIDHVEQSPRAGHIATVHYQGKANSDPVETRGMLKAVKENAAELARL